MVCKSYGLETKTAERVALLNSICRRDSSSGSGRALQGVTLEGKSQARSRWKPELAAGPHSQARLRAQQLQHILIERGDREIAATAVMPGRWLRDRGLCGERLRCLAQHRKGRTQYCKCARKNSSAVHKPPPDNAKGEIEHDSIICALAP